MNATKNAYSRSFCSVNWTLGEASANVVRAASYIVAGLPDEYARLYYTGMVHEREGRAHVGREGTFAYSKLRYAAELFDQCTTASPGVIQSD